MDTTITYEREKPKAENLIGHLKMLGDIDDIL